MTNKFKDMGIEHIVVLMLENRGFDHVMGWLYSPDEKPNLISKISDSRPFLGLSSLSKQELDKLANKNPLEPQNPIKPIKGARSPAIPEFNPGEHFTHIMSQMWSLSRTEVDWTKPDIRASAIYKQYKKYDDAPMTGYVSDFKETIEHEAHATATTSLVSQIMETYIPEQLPVLSGLARHYAVSDEWYCSVPSQTNTNRAFSTAGTSRGLVTNNYYDMAFQPGSYRVYAGTKILQGAAKISGMNKVTGSHTDELPITTRTLFEVLSTYDVEWKIYWQSTWPPKGLASGSKAVQYVRAMFPELAASAYNKNFVQIDPDKLNNQLFKDARNGKLPAVSWIEPKWGGGPLYNPGSAVGSKNEKSQKLLYQMRMVGTDMHPSCDTTVAEDFIHNLYQALSESTKWDKTLFIITFDENGGTYDHMPPFGSRPRSDKPEPPPDNWTPSPSGLDRTPPPGAIGGSGDMDPKTRTEFGFEFDQFGIRVPTIFISPLIKKNTLLRSSTEIPFDHTSLMASILDWQGINRKNWFLGNRTFQAPLFDSVFPYSKPETRKDIKYSTSIKKSQGTDEEIFANQNYILRYLGNPWGIALNPGKYLASPEWSTIYHGYFPTLNSSPLNAVAIKLQLVHNNLNATTISNMSRLKIAFANAPTLRQPIEKIPLPNIAVNNRYTNVFCASKGTFDADVWQIRTMASRDSSDKICLGDTVCFISTAPSDLFGVKNFDPYQRLAPYPEDSKYLSTRSGIWGAWKIEKYD